ncbi:MAG: nitroreductase family protein [Selenomonadales bacterium]|jgi:nitroreductase|nr:nitroreductase family protein [Selenomonadales bacterium]
MREFKYQIMPEIMRRWSPRAFSDEPVAGEEVLALLEAARFAPSCYNEQPWRFIVAQTSEALQKMQGLLTEQNLLWAKHAPVLLLLLAKRTFSETGQENYWHMFDTGTAWGYLSLEAERRGLITHAMGGFSRKRAIALYDLPPDIAPVALVAVGKLGNSSLLAAELRERERPGVRRQLSELVIHSS